MINSQLQMFKEAPGLLTKKVALAEQFGPRPAFLSIQTATGCALLASCDFAYTHINTPLQYLKSPH